MGENYFHGRVFSVKKYASAVTDDRTRVEVFIIISKQVYSILFFTSCPIKTFVVDDLGIVSTFQRFQLRIMVLLDRFFILLSITPDFSSTPDAWYYMLRWRWHRRM